MKRDCSTIWLTSFDRFVRNVYLFIIVHIQFNRLSSLQLNGHDMVQVLSCMQSAIRTSISSILIIPYLHRVFKSPWNTCQHGSLFGLRCVQTLSVSSVNYTFAFPISPWNMGMGFFIIYFIHIFTQFHDFHQHTIFDIVSSWFRVNSRRFSGMGTKISFPQDV